MYKLEGKDIVLSGFEEGISDSVYSGIAEMRNVEITTVPGEASVELAMAAAVKPVALDNVAYTAQNTGDTITIASTAGLYEGTAIVLASNTATGLTNGIVYYVHNIVGNTFQVRLMPAFGSATPITSDGTGTLSTYQFNGGVISYWVDRTGQMAGINSLLVVDYSNRVWAILTAAPGSMPAGHLIFMGNIGTSSAITSSGIAVWNEYIVLFTFPNAIDIADASSVFSGSGPATNWTYNWKNYLASSINGRVGVLVSQEDGNLYWTTNEGVGSIIEQPNETFNPADSDTYTITDAAIPIPSTDQSTCLAELGTNLLIGGRNSFIYIWDKVSLGFNSLLNIPDTFTTAIVAASQNAYVFSGVRGRIYITNGSGIDLYKKIPDYVTGAINPLIRWSDAGFSRNQLIFSFYALSNSGTALNTTAGAWAIDLETDALRLLNKTTNTGYGGNTRMVTEYPSSNSGNPTAGIRGTSIALGWDDGSAFGIDLPTSTPYTNYESFIQTEMVPAGTYLDPFTPSQIEWKTSAPLVAGEAVRLSYRGNISEPFVAIGESTTAGAISDMYQTNFQKSQWVQFLIEIKSTATTPSLTRMTEIRIRDWPSGKANKN